MQLFVVKRDRLSTFKMLSEQLANVPDVRVIWDRRSPADRRERPNAVVPERRQRERRKPHELRGPVAEYVIVTVRAGDEARGVGEPRTSGRTRVLVVDDSPTALLLLRALFEREDYEVVPASDGLEGLEQVRLCRPDLIVTDSVMPGLDGFAFVQRLKESPATRLIPVIMLTTDPYPPRAVSEAQPDAVVAKSATMEPLVWQVKDLLKRARQET